MHYVVQEVTFIPREESIYPVTLSTPTKLSTTFAPLVASIHSTNLALILRHVAFHCSVWMKKKLKRKQKLFHVMLQTGRSGNSTLMNIQKPEISLKMWSSIQF